MKIEIGKRYEDRSGLVYFAHARQKCTLSRYPVIVEFELDGTLHAYKADGKHSADATCNLVKLYEPAQHEPYTRETFLAAGLADAWFCSGGTSGIEHYMSASAPWPSAVSSTASMLSPRT